MSNVIIPQELKRHIAKGGNSVLKMLYPSLLDLAKVRDSLLANENINEV